MTVACSVTCGGRHDSPAFRETCKNVPEGSGYVLLDAAYLARRNRDVIADSGRMPVICPRKNCRARGLDPMGKMLRRHRDDPAGFEKACHRRSLVENAFSVIRERFGAVARAGTAEMRRLQLIPGCVCYNLAA